VQLAQKTARLIAAVIERDELERRLRERKVVERAKGILQQRDGLSEEHAYLLLRSTSRHRSLPMFDVVRGRRRST
jgi:AmiR/NasT family two-component response regulator